MIQVFLFLHVLAAILMGFYLMLPFLSARLSALKGQAQHGFLHVLFSANRAGQLGLVISFLSGGYLAGKGHYSIVWMILAVVLFLALGALTGILGKAMRGALTDESGSQIAGKLGKIKSLSSITGIIFLVLIIIMKFPNWFM